MGKHSLRPHARLDPELSPSLPPFLLGNAVHHEREGRTRGTAGVVGGSIALAQWWRAEVFEAILAGGGRG